jgi:mRNA-degrading endonuclease RelE of RelBE toxin-antitoxin system
MRLRPSGEQLKFFVDLKARGELTQCSATATIGSSNAHGHGIVQPMPAFQIELTDDAGEDLDFLPARDQKVILSRTREQLSVEPGVETRNRKRLRVNPIATWELRIGKFRVFCEIDDAAAVVTIVAIGWKEHSKLIIRGVERNL